MEKADITLTQDDDVLDTWYSSGLFPFSVFGWPDNTEDLEAFCPTTLLETGHDILFFWVARMVMMGLGLTGKLPFKTVLLHSLVRDKKGRKMSKSVGNVIDPLEVIEGVSLIDETKIKNSNLPAHEIQRAIADQRDDYPKGIPECGADALRIGLLAYMTQGGDINLDVGRVIGYRNFCNKLWNATNFALSHLGESFIFYSAALGEAIRLGETFDLWILSRLNETIAKVNQAFLSYNLGDAVSTVNSFCMNELCAVYLEGLKPVMKGSNETQKNSARTVLFECLSAGIRLLHPMMPFVTEELYQRLPGPTTPDSICIAPYPVARKQFSFKDAEASMDSVMKNVQAIRALKAEYGLKPSSAPSAVIMASCGDLAAKIVPEHVQTLVLCAPVTVLVSGESESPHGTAVKVVEDVFEAHIVLKGMVGFESEITKLRAASAQKHILVEDYDKKMAAQGYDTRVPLKVRQKNSAASEIVSTSIS